ncbi:MAG: hypothetical protein RR272_01845 [Synergistaceae bacterium]
MAVIGRISQEVLKMITLTMPQNEKENPCPEDIGGLFTGKKETQETNSKEREKEKNK